MRHVRGTLSALAVATLTFTALSPAQADPTEVTGPSSSKAPYLLSVAPGVKATSIISVGDMAENGYKMVGIPDGLGAYNNGDGTFTVLMNHELGADKGIARAHGAAGAFVSKWVIDKSTLKVIKGEDLIKRVMLATGGTWSQASGIAAAMNRLCSADLPSRKAFYRAANRFGSKARIFMNGEEGGVEGRAFAHVASGRDAGSSYELPALGKAAWENIVASPYSKNKTVTVGLDDGQGGQVYVYVGKKSRKGNDVQRAGLTGGMLYGVKVDGLSAESTATTLASVRGLVWFRSPVPKQ
jgi:hypothetical protein